MQNKFILPVLGIVGGLMVGGWLVYSFVGGRVVTGGAAPTNSAVQQAAASSPSGASGGSENVTRADAVKMILSAIKQQPPEVNWQQNTSFGFTVICQNNTVGDISVLEKDGLVTNGAGNLPIATGEAQQYMIGSNTALAAEVENVDVTGIKSIPMANMMSADYTATYQVTPFGQACSYPSVQDGHANFQLYDSGWRFVGFTIN